MRLPQSTARAVERAGLVVAALGLCGGAAAVLADTRRFAFAYLVGFAWVTTLAVGALAFVLLQHLARAGWSVAPRRQMEWLAGVLPWCLALFVPVALLGRDVYEWMQPAAHHDPLVHGKAPYLNPLFFGLRSVVFLGLWAAVAHHFRRASRRQDESGDPALTAGLQRKSAPAVVFLGLSASFAAFDWLMSLDPRWASSIFGIYVLAGALTAALAALALGTIVLERRGLLGRVSTVEHRHDIGKLLFGFNCFWAYIAFCQYFLIWYANIPEEMAFYRHRWEGSWSTVSLLLVIGHFAVPFALLLGRTGKRSPLVLGATAAVLLAMHYVDLYWIVMPTLDHHGAHPSWIDLAGLLAPAGVLAAWVARRAARDPVYPTRDPRLAEAMRLENP